MICSSKTCIRSRRLLIFLAVNWLIVLFMLHRAFPLIQLLVENGTADTISHAALTASSAGLADQSELIPKIIHQTYKSDTIPSRWLDARNSCIDMHPDYEYMLWTDKKARAFIATKYPWFLDSFDGYRNAIQRADAIRYFILVYYGGIYIDLDDGCNRRLDKLLIYPAWVRRTTPTGISNDVIGSIPQHPFFLQVIEALKPYDRNWILPYVTIMYTTGPLFLSVIWRQYTLHGPSRTWPVRILSLEDYGLHRNSFFTQYNGSSWHGGDASVIFWMGRHWLFLTFCGVIVGALVILFNWWMYCQLIAWYPRFHLCHSLCPGPFRHPFQSTWGKLLKCVSKAKLTDDEEAGNHY